MRDLALQKTVLTLITLLLAVPLTMAQPAASKSSGKAIVIDERLSALREDADTQAQVVRRLQLGQPVTILGMKGGKDGQRFYRVAVTSRTRGWVHELAVALPGRAGEDERVMKLIEAMDEGVERLELCRIFLEHFSRSPLAPRVLMAMGEEADRAAASLTRRVHRRLGESAKDSLSVPLRILYLNDVSLDRYSKLNVRFDFNESAHEYVYDGQAYRDLIKRFPDSEEAGRARQKLDRRAEILNHK